MVNCIISGLISGIGFSLLGYAKSIPDGETFNWKKFVPTIVIGAISGIVACQCGADIATINGKFAEYGVIALVNSIWIVILKNQKTIVSRVRGWWRSISHY